MVPGQQLTLLKQTQHWVALHKPAGVSFHSESGPGLVVQAEQQLGMKLYPVHRLDKVTSGVLLLATSSAAAAELAALFAEQRIEKYYLALSADKPKSKQGWVKGDMAAARRGAWKLLHSQRQPAVSYFVSQGFTELPFRAFLIKPWTGKTHQIRVALKSIGAAILGDELYGSPLADRVYLHAYALCFSWRGQPVQLCCWPETGVEFDRLQHHIDSRWASPWQLAWPEYRQPRATNDNG
ncbi:MAG: RNA pseudouridine synthase [Alkalimonas sp.]|nr:RNA pseudouridine synthase [Alkalimonas sp.]